jgi:hypothetical protein
VVSVVGAGTTLTLSFAREEVIGIPLSPPMSADLCHAGRRRVESVAVYKPPAMRGLRCLIRCGTSPWSNPAVQTAHIDKIGLALAPRPAPEVDPGHAREQEQHQRRTADVDGA